MTDVKAISIPEGPVKTIFDLNNNLVWGSYDAFPYRRLEYIQSTGKQAFDTGVKPARNSYMKLVIEDMDTNDAPNGRGAVANAQRFGAGYRTNNGKHYFRFGIGSGWLDGPERSAGKHTIGVQGPECKVLGNGQGYYIDGTFTANSNSFPSASTTWYSVYLLGSRGDTSGSIQEPCWCKMYYAEYGYTRTDNSDQGINKAFIPVQRKSDGRLGFYDIINNTFMGDLVSGSESGTLIAGPVVDEYFSPYRKLEYLNMGGNWINTQMKPSASMYFMSFKLDPSAPLYSGDYAQLWGAIGYSNSASQRAFIDYNTANIYQRCKAQANTSMYAVPSMNVDTMYETRFRAYSVNNTSGQWWYALQDITNSAELYGQFYNNSSLSMNLNYFPYICINRNVYKTSASTSATVYLQSQAGGNGNFKLYGYRINATGTSPTDSHLMYPCQRKGDDVCGLYDVITSTFYPCEGFNTTSSAAGPVVDEYWDLTA